jgi:hypothetical protein
MRAVNTSSRIVALFEPLFVVMFAGITLVWYKTISFFELPRKTLHKIMMSGAEGNGRVIRTLQAVKGPGGVVSLNGTNTVLVSHTTR